MPAPAHPAPPRDPTPRGAALRRLAARAPRLARPLDAAILLEQHRAHHGRWPRLVVPATFNDWVFRRLLLDRNPLLRVLCDKLAVRDHVRATLGRDIAVPLLAVCDRPEDLPWDRLPRAFVLKASHGSGFNVVVEDRDAVDRGAMAARLRACLAVDYYEMRREWGYRGIPRRRLVEPLLRSPGEFVLPDWKFHCFGGEPRVLHVVRMDRALRRSVSLFTMAGRHLPVTYSEPRGPPTLPPGDLPALAAVARRLAQGFDYLRVDLYCLDGQVRFGELTPYLGAGLFRFDPPEFDAWMGALWTAARRGTLPPPPPG